MAGVSPHCKRVIEEFESDKTKCLDFRAIRAYAMCLAWKIMEERKVPFRFAIREAWRRAKDLCRGVYD